MSENEKIITIQERKEKGRTLREQVPQISHGKWKPSSSRPDPISLLQEQDTDKLKHLLPIKYGRMLKSPFAFMRGAAVVMAADLAATPVTGMEVQLCGDAHLLNFGIFATPERKLVFDINDFDETYPGPWEWDLKRLAASAVVAGRENGFGDDVNRKMATAVCKFYRKAMRSFAQAAFLDVWYYQVEVDKVIEIFGRSSKKSRKDAQKVAKNARDHTQSYTMEKLTEVIDGKRRIRNNPPLLMRLNEIMSEEEKTWVIREKHVEKMFHDYVNSLTQERHRLISYYQISDGALRIGGIGSIGTRCAILLLEGAAENDALILQLKEAGPSVLESYLEKKDYPGQAWRVVAGQKLMQATSDIFLGWHENISTGIEYYWRQLKDMKGSFDLDSLDKFSMETYLKVCSLCLARAHARTGDAAFISGYIGKSDEFPEAITDFAVAYADQTERDYKALKDAVKSGRLVVEKNV